MSCSQGQTLKTMTLYLGPFSWFSSYCCMSTALTWAIAVFLKQLPSGVLGDKEL